MPPKEEEIVDRGDDFTPTVVTTMIEVEAKPEVIEGDDVVTEKPDVADKKEKFIPRERFDEVNSAGKLAKEEAATAKAEAEGLRQRLAALEAKGTPEPVIEPEPEIDTRAKLKELRAQSKEALDDGDMDEYHRINDEIQEEGIRIAKVEFQAESKAESAKAKVADALTDVAADAFKLYPFLDHNSATHDADAILSVQTRSWALQKEGKTPAEALRMAVDEKGPRFAQLNGVTIPTGKADEIRKQREAKQREKGAGASLQPPALGTGEAETFKVDIKSLSDAEYAKLPESVKARARGDNFAGE
jgi:hypothetical protein